MDKRLILAVAGAGKTRLLIDRLDWERRALIVTHTNNNFRNIRSRIVTKFGYPPENIHVMTYFSFLYGFSFRPYLSGKTAARGLNYEPCPNRFARGRARFFDHNRRAYANRLAKFIQDEGAAGDVTARIGKYFDLVMIDEVQDFAGNDFNFLPLIVGAKAEVLLVGDFFQHTFDTSRDGAVRKNLHKDYERYVEQFGAMGLVVDRETLSHSYRCGPAVCAYITKHLGIPIGSHRDDETGISFVEAAPAIRELHDDPSVIKLFYQNAHRHYRHARNWGASKGEDHYNDVCVVLNSKTYQAYQRGTLHSLPPSTRNKLYVAITRCRGKLYFIEERALRNAAS